MCQPAWVDQEDGVGGGCDGRGDLREMQVHRLGVAGRQDQGCAPALLWADRAEDVGGSGALVAGRAWTGAALRPAAGDLVLLADTSLICEPDFYRVDADRLLTRESPPPAATPKGQGQCPSDWMHSGAYCLEMRRDRR
jgi:hypothetical protein